MFSFDNSIFLNYLFINAVTILQCQIYNISYSRAYTTLRILNDNGYSFK